MEILYTTFPWYISGFLIGLTMLFLVYVGKTFGMSTNLKTMCSLLGADKINSFFADWQDQKWNLLVVLGVVLGGFFASHFLNNGSGIQINPITIEQLKIYGIDAPNGNYLPNALFSIEALQAPKTIILLLVGGLLIGFGTRYAGGCTSGHAITGLSNFQLPSLIAVIGFFIGGLVMIHVLFPIIFGN